MYKIRNFDIEESVKYIKPNSLYNKIMEKVKKTKHYSNIIEESKTYKVNKVTTRSKFNHKADLKGSKKVLEEVYSNPLDFSKKIFNKIEKAKNKNKRATQLLHENFSINIFEDKTSKDLKYLTHIFEETFNFIKDELKVKTEINESLENTVNDLLKKTLVESVQLHKEANIKPRYLTPALASRQLTENELINIYNKNFKRYLTENYLIPLQKGELQDSKEIVKFAKTLMENGIDVNLDDLVVYLPFEKTVRSFFESILLPDGSKFKLNLFLENQDDIYFEYFEENAKYLNECMHSDIGKIASMVSPFLFKNKIDTEMSEDFNPVKMAGVSMACEKIDDGPMVCKVKKGEAVDDEDIEDDIEDEIEKNEDKDISNKEDIEDEIEKLAAEDSLGLDDEDIDSSNINSDDDIVKEIEDELEAEDIDDAIGNDIDEEIFDEDSDEDSDEKSKKKGKGSKEDLKENTLVQDALDEVQKHKHRSKGANFDEKLTHDEEILNKEEIVDDDASNFTSKDLK